MALPHVQILMSLLMHASFLFLKMLQKEITSPGSMCLSHEKLTGTKTFHSVMNLTYDNNFLFEITFTNIRLAVKVTGCIKCLFVHAYVYFVTSSFMKCLNK